MTNTFTADITNLATLPNVAQQLLQHFSTIKVYALSGPLGAGKTALVKCFCEALNTVETASSPTFSLINSYNLQHSSEQVYHMDLYRIKNLAEALDLNFNDYINSNCYCFIEWPEQINNWFTCNYVKVILTHNITNNSRILTAEPVTDNQTF